MFGMNEIVGKKYFSEEPENTLMVTSRFFTLQGEGPYRGQPAYFIRLTKCNLSCSFCDTYFDKGDRLTYDELIDQAYTDIQNFFKSRDQNMPEWVWGPKSKVVLVITGGEPSLQANLKTFLEKAEAYFGKSQIESNGVLLANIPDWTTYVVSPKCREKNGMAVEYLMPNPEMLKRADCLKFVMDFSSEQFSPYSSIPDWAIKWAAETGKDVFVSPMNIYKKEPAKAKEIRSQNKEITIDERSTVDEVISFWEPDLLDLDQNKINHERTAEYAMKQGFILNLQMHLFASLP